MRFRYQILSLVFTLVFAAVIYQSYHLQVLERDQLLAKSREELETSMSLGAVRGEIYDANGERLAASLAVASLSVDTTLLDAEQLLRGRHRDWLRPFCKALGLGEVKTLEKLLRDDPDYLKKEVAARLHPILGLEQNELQEKISSGRQFIWLKRKLEPDETAALEDINLPGLRLTKEYRRVYPNGSLAAHFLGFVGVDGQGLEGLELALDNRLQAHQDEVRVKRDRRGRKMLDKVEGDLSQARGASVVLTIDRRIQYITEKALAKAVTQHRAKSGMALVMRPATGAIVASAVWPSFDPNDYEKTPNSSRRNRILTDPFEPGSTFKVFVVAAALEEGLVSPTTIINAENGAYKVANHIVKDTHSYGDLTVSEVIKLSSNIGALKIGTIVGNNLLYNYLTRFTFGEKTGLAHLPGEASGLLRHPRHWRQLEAANIAFGQGLSVTTLQMVMAMCSLANQGVLMKPYIVEKVLDENGAVLEQYQPQILRQVVSPLTARQVAAMLRMVVMKGGTGTRAEVTGYPVAGKTGTAQKVVRGNKTYTAGKYVSSFLGFAPYHDPQLCVMVVLDEPEDGYYAGTVAAPAFKEIMENALPLLDIPPTEGLGDPVWPIIQRNSGGAPGVVEGQQPTNFIRVRLKKNDRGAKGAITFASLSPEKALTAGAPEPEFIDNALPRLAAPGVMPDLAGLSMRQVLEIMMDYGLDLEYLGSGHVVGQKPEPGQTVASGQPAAVIFER
ncbi:MAG: transpeptidase family protein [Candidatus Adiutrix sp.]|nr:transpeptidase family protein [Candidatus Adiutrix sp.]